MYPQAKDKLFVENQCIARPYLFLKSPGKMSLKKRYTDDEIPDVITFMSRDSLGKCGSVLRMQPA